MIIPRRREDQYGHFTTTVYDAAGDATATADPFGNRTRFIFDAYGRPVAMEDQYGHFTTTVYGAYGRVCATIDIYGMSADRGDPRLSGNRFGVWQPIPCLATDSAMLCV
jgi:YD repeat-containing protein